MAKRTFNAGTLGAAHLQPTLRQPTLDHPPTVSHTKSDGGNGAKFLLKNSFGTDTSAPRSLLVNN